MSRIKENLDVCAAGLAIFSMFFGAGNIIFPLALGPHALDKTPIAILGLLATAVFMPFAGLLAMFLYNGDVKAFFCRIGNIPGMCVAFFVISLLGPLGSSPRCIALSYATFKMFFPHISVTLFSALACVVIFFFAYKKNRLLDLLGYVLTPFLVICLGLIIVKGYFDAPETMILSTDYSSLSAFWHGFKEGYNMMDLLAAFFFAPVILSAVKRKAELGSKAENFSLSTFVLKASVIGASLLGIIYVGFGFLASYYASDLTAVPSEELLATVAFKVLGPYAGLVIGSTVILACLTTAIALIAAFSDFLYRDVLSERISYTPILIGSLLVTFFFATFEFQGISQFLSPILNACYPALILLTGVNLCFHFIKYKTLKFTMLGLFVSTIGIGFLCTYIM